MKKNNFLLLKKIQNTENAQLWPTHSPLFLCDDEKVGEEEEHEVLLVGPPPEGQLGVVGLLPVDPHRVASLYQPPWGTIFVKAVCLYVCESDHKSHIFFGKRDLTC